MQLSLALLNTKVWKLMQAKENNSHDLNQVMASQRQVKGDGYVTAITRGILS